MFKNNHFLKLNHFFSKRKVRSHKKREVILRPTDIPSGIFFIEKGYVRQYIISEDGKELTTVIYKPRDLFPIRWALLNMPLQSHFEAMTPVEVRHASKEEFIKFLKKEPEAFLLLTSRIINRLHAILERMEHLAFGSSYNKVASLLLLLVERFGKKSKSFMLIQIPLTHQDIASMLGLTRETVSISMKKLFDKGIISRYDQFIIVKSIRKLEKEASLTVL